MAENKVVFNDSSERQGVFHRRIFVMGGVVAFGLFALTGRLGYLQLLQGGRYARLSEANQYNFRLIPPPRGEILDRYGKVVAGNRPSFRVMIMANEVKDIDKTLDQITYILPQTEMSRRRILRDINQNQRFIPTIVASDLTWEDFSRVNLFAAEIPGVVADVDQLRVYYYGGAFSHIIGYVSRINAKELEQEGDNPDPMVLHPGFRIGKLGVEKTYDKILRGEAGGQKIEVNAYGKVVAEDPEGSRAGKPGTAITLTIDAEVQQRAMEAFGEDSGAAVVMDIHTGEIICMTSSPSFDPNLFVSGISTRAYRLLADYERRPLLDKAIGSTFAPGSTFKMATSLAILDAGIDPSEQVVCRGGYQSGNRFFRCHAVHGAVDMHNALKFSCDTYFYHFCNRAGVDRIAERARRLGLGKIFESFEILGQKKGLIPDQEYKRTQFKNDPKWHPGETLSVAIGQGYTHVSPLQLAVYTARIANGAKAVEPHLVRKIGDQLQDHTREYADLGIPREHLEIVRGGMFAVSNDTDGTAYRNSQLGLGALQMSGKTGTAQVRNYGTGTRRAEEWHRKDHGLFVCFAPSDRPKYACAVVVQHGVAGGRFAAPKAREIMRLTLMRDPETQKRITGPVNTALDVEALRRGQTVMPGETVDTVDAAVITEAAPNATRTGQE